MADYPAIDADGHIIERREELRQYMEVPEGKILHDNTLTLYR